MKKAMIDNYGLEDRISFEPDTEQVKEEDKFRAAFFNMNLTVSDGHPIQIPNFDFLHVGSIGSAYSLDKLNSAGITHILCLSNAIKLKFRDSFSYLRIPMTDKTDYDIVSKLDQAFEFIELARNHLTTDGKPGKILVHCYQGKSRCIAVCCAYLFKFYQIKIDSALEMIRSVRPIANPNSGFMAELYKYEQGLTEKLKGDT